MAKYKIKVELVVECMNADSALSQLVDVIKGKPVGIEDFYVRKSSVNGLIEVILLGNNIHKAPRLTQ